MRWPPLILALAALACTTTGGGASDPADAPPPPIVEKALTRFEGELVKIERSLPQPPLDERDPEWVKARLTLMYHQDQFTRNYSMEAHKLGFSDAERSEFLRRFMPRWQAIDKGNTAALKQIIEVHGWPVISRFGTEADHRAWLLVQHADLDRDFQRAMLAVLEGLVRKGETNPTNVAYLHDRLATADGKPQRYGTQGKCTGKGAWEANVVEAPEGLDERRRVLGLPSMAEYRKAVTAFCP